MQALPAPPRLTGDSRPLSSIPAKAGISFSQQREFSAKRNIALVACRRMRLRRRDSGFRRNGNSFNFRRYLFPIPALFPFPPPFPFPPLLSFPPPSSIPAKAGISSRECGKFPRSGNQCRLRRCVADDAAPRDSRFRGNGSSFNFAALLSPIPALFPFPPLLSFPPPFPFPRKRESLPANAGNFRKAETNVACGDAWRTMPPREIPAFAGMEILLISPPLLSPVPTPLSHSRESGNLPIPAPTAQINARGEFPNRPRPNVV